MSKSFSESYRAAGVDVTAGYRAVDLMKRHVSRTRTPEVLDTIGGFGGMLMPDLTGIAKPVLVSGTDGVGTKLKIAFLMDKHDTVGIDCVAMCVNDVVCCGAKPLLFLDYIALGKNVPEKVAEIVSGVAEGCVQSGCALVGGETAEMPGFYPADEYDLAGFSVGIADQENMLDGSTMQEGDLLVGLGSSGVHSNGFSLVRKVLGEDAKTLNTHVAELGCTLGEELLKPTHIYVKAIRCLLKHGVHIRAISHITGGGLYENVPRMMKPGLTARIETASFPVPPIFDLIAKQGKIDSRDMYNTFNMGVGLVIAIPRDEIGNAKNFLCRAGERAYIIGSVVKGDEGVVLV